MSKAQKDLRIRINNEEDAANVILLRNQRNNILNEIKKEQKRINEKEIDKMTDEIAEAENDVKFYK